MPRPRVTVAVFNESTGWRLPEPLVDVVRRAAGEEVEVRSVGTRAELGEALEETAYLIGIPITEEQAVALRGRVRWAHLTASLGDESPLLAAVLGAGARVTSAAGIRAAQMSEHALALALALYRRLDLAITAQADQKWVGPEAARGARTLAGAVIGLIADGSVARELAHRAGAFGVSVLLCRPHSAPEPGVGDGDFPFERLADFMERCDIVAVACARTARTAGRIARAEIGWMKTGAVLIDVSRGGVVQTAHLAEALRRGRLSGAGLDAFEKEPLAPNSPLWSLPGVVVSPHIASASTRYWERGAEIIGANIRRVAEGGPPPDEVRAEWFARTPGEREAARAAAR